MRSAVLPVVLLDSAPERGTRVTVRWPAAAPAARQEHHVLQ
ncbi:MAG TPA: hypothetical protein VE153_22975 [Myxococcus sp.]|nr:hypothetical protein [Myxococcus sp.]